MSITDLQLGKFLQIAFADGVRTQLSTDHRDWEHIKACKASDPNGREVRFFIKSSFGPAAVQSRAATTTAFPASQKSKNLEHSAEYKEIDATIEIEYNLWNRARKSIDKYADPLLNEIEDKMIATKRYMASKLYQDGSGILGVVASVSDNATTNKVVVTLNEGDTVSDYSHIGYFEYDEILTPREDAAGAPERTPQTVAPADLPNFYGWRVVDRSRNVAGSTITIEPIDAAGNVLTAFNTSELVAGDFFCKVGQQTIVAPSEVTGSTDYGRFTDVMVGLGSLAAADSRVVHGLTMSGAVAGTEVDAGNVALDATQIRSMLDNAKIRVGENRYSYKKLCLAPEAEAAFIDSRDTDRRFNAVQDLTNGASKFIYQHRNDSLETYTSEFVPFKRAYALPEQKNGEKVLEYWGSDFEPVQAEGMGKFHLKAGASGYERAMVSYMEAIGQLVCRHPAAIGRLRNFTL
jgi:hypothetical protein